jgi:hypothetical protein
VSSSTKPTLLRVLVTRRHVQRYETFVSRFTQAARVLAERERDPRLASLTIGRRQYERWLSGNMVRRPHPDSCRVLEHMFSYTVDELFSPVDDAQVEASQPAARLPAPVRVPTHPARPTGGAHDLVLLHADPGVADVPETSGAADVAGVAGASSATDDMRHRAVLRGIASGIGNGLTVPALEVIEAIRRSMDATLTDQGGMEMLEEWERRAEDLTQAYMVTSPLSLLRDALLDFGEVQSALKRGQYGRHRPRLWWLSARLAGMIGLFLSVLGQHRDARAWFYTGRRAAHLCDDQVLQAWMYVRAAGVSLHYGTPASAVTLTDKAAALHPGPSGTSVRTQLVRARALARVGDQANARDALEQAHRSFEVLDGADSSDKVFGYTERQVLAHSANVVTSLHDTRAAQRLQDQALAGFAGKGGAERLDPILVQIDQARCLLWESDLTGACRHMMDAFAALPAEHRTALIRAYALAFVAELTPRQHQLPAAEELKDYLAAAFAHISA